MTPDNTKRAVRWTAAGLTVLAVTGATAAIGANPFPAPSQPSQVATRSYDASWSHDSHHEHEGIIEQVRGVVERILGDDDAAAAGVAPQASYVQSAPAASSGAS